MFYFKFHIGDYRSDAQHLTLLEHGVYFTLMSTYYITEHPLPKDERQLFRLAGARTDEERQAVIDIVNEFFIPTETHWVHSRIEFEIKEYQSKADANRENGKKGGRPKKNQSQKPKENPSGFDSLKNKTQVVSETEPNNNPNITLTNKPINPLTHEPNINNLNIEKPKKEKAVLKTLPDDFEVSERVKRWAFENNHSNLDLHFERFVELAKMKMYKYADWDLAFMKAIREDWGKVNSKTINRGTDNFHDQFYGVGQSPFGHNNHQGGMRDVSEGYFIEHNDDRKF